MKQPFAMYRIPGEQHIRLVEGDAVSLMYDIEELNGKRGFVMVPFKVDREHPIVLIEASSVTLNETSSVILSELEGSHLQPPSMMRCFDFAQPDYTHRFETFVSALRSGKFDKLVLSRSINLKRHPEFLPEKAFHEACRRYLYSYIYMCSTPQTGTWLGCTPEIILSGKGDEWHTVALAGTQPLQDGKLPQTWSEKNRREQEYVASYVRSRLSAQGIRFAESGAYPTYAGALSHLKTDFRFALPNHQRLGDFLKALHPTPAVCGLPKEDAYRFIIDNEGYDRSYYSGFVGWIDPDGQTDLYVNLRCMHIGDHALTLYAGSGLLASSECDDEWTETERKLQTMKRVLN